MLCPTVPHVAALEPVRQFLLRLTSSKTESVEDTEAEEAVPAELVHLTEVKVNVAISTTKMLTP
jgi:hypothetical protein